MKLLSFLLLGILMSSFFLSCSTDEKVKPLDPQNMDTSVRAADDFFQYANGAWIKNNPIPDDYSRYGVFEVLAENNWKDVRSILEEAANGSFDDGSNMQKIGDL